MAADRKMEKKQRLGKNQKEKERPQKEKTKRRHHFVHNLVGDRRDRFVQIKRLEKAVKDELYDAEDVDSYLDADSADEINDYLKRVLQSNDRDIFERNIKFFTLLYESDPTESVVNALITIQYRLGNIGEVRELINDIDSSVCKDYINQSLIHLSSDEKEALIKLATDTSEEDSLVQAAEAKLKLG